MLMLFQGPVGEASHGGRVNPWFSLAAGFIVLGITWTHYLRRERGNRPPLTNVLGVSAICLVFIFFGFFELAR